MPEFDGGGSSREPLSRPRFLGPIRVHNQNLRMADTSRLESPVLNGLGPFSVLAIGLLAGWIAQRIVDRRLSLWGCLGLGCLGAFCGAWIAGLVGLSLPGLLGGMILSTTGSVLLLAVFVLARRGR